MRTACEPAAFLALKGTESPESCRDWKAAEIDHRPGRTLPAMQQLMATAFLLSFVAPLTPPSSIPEA